MSKIKVMIVDDIEETRENIKRLLYFEQDIDIVAEASNGEEAVKEAVKTHPDIILMDINMPQMDGIAATEAISVQVPCSAIIIMSVQGEQEYLKKAMAAGAREYIVKPFTSDELIKSIRAVYELQEKRKLSAFGCAANNEDDFEPQLVTVFSTKGGVGKTLIATNLAVALAQETRKKVVLVDLDLQFGDVAVMLNVVPKRTITELVQDFNHLDEKVLESYLLSHPSGIKILPAPTRPEYSELVTASHIEKILKLLKKNYEYIVIDTAPYFNEVNLTALDASDQILLLATMDLPTIKNVRLSLEILETLHHKGKVKLILNRSDVDMGIKCQDMERSLNFLVAAHIPSDGRVAITSINKGIPLMAAQTSSKIAQGIRQLSRIVINNEGTQEDLKRRMNKGLVGRLFG